MHKHPPYGHIKLFLSLYLWTPNTTPARWVMPYMQAVLTRRVSSEGSSLEFCVIMFLKDQQNVAKGIGKVFVHVGIAIKKVSSCKHAKTDTLTYMVVTVSCKFYVTVKLDQS